MEKLNENVSSQISRMKEMMNYGLKTETKNYSSVEYERTAADGKKYAIIREGAKYHIKVSDKKNPSKSDYDYIGGFANHKMYMFESYANALKHFDMKMTSINEAAGKRGKVESWNVNGRDNILAEASNNMRLEIERQREIMKNAATICEGKSKDMSKKAASEIEKRNIKVTKPQIGTAQNQGGDFFTEKVPTNTDTENLGSSEKDNIKGKQQPVLENVEGELFDAPLSGGINIASNNTGDGAGQTNVMAEDEDAEDSTDDFEIEDDIEVEGSDDDFDEDFEEDDELEEFPEEDEEEFEEDDIEDENDDDISALRAEIESLRSTIDAMAEKLGVDEFDTDEPLYDDEETEYEFEADDEDFDEDEEEYEFEAEDEEDDDDEEDDEGNVFESRSYRNLMEAKLLDKAKEIGKKAVKKVKRALENYNDDVEIYGNEGAPNPSNPNVTDKDWDDFEKKKKRVKDERKKKREKEDAEELDETTLHVFGKHPRFQKEPMTYPTPNMAKKPGQYEEGADEDNTNKPYATSIGDATPFGDGPKAKKVINSIAENVMRKLLKNL